jgi:tRNA A37 threonylcarbamoyladenosine synthetase subunit TsaC/SUA5/YrdC
MYQTMVQTSYLQTRNIKHLKYTAELIASGEIVAFEFYGAFAFLGDADQEQAAYKIFKIKNRPFSQTLSLVCPPEYLHEHVDLEAICRHYSFDKIRRLYREIHTLGIILPAAIPGAPPHLLKDGTIHNVWTEYPPAYPIRQLVNQLRQMGRRALLGASANMSGEPAYRFPEEVAAAYEGQIAAIISDEPANIPLLRKKSTTMLDLTRGYPRLHREGNVPEAELRAYLARLGFPELVVDDSIIKL